MDDYSFYLYLVEGNFHLTSISSPSKEDVQIQIINTFYVIGFRLYGIYIYTKQSRAKGKHLWASLSGSAQCFKNIADGPIKVTPSENRNLWVHPTTN